MDYSSDQHNSFMRWLQTKRSRNILLILSISLILFLTALTLPFSLKKEPRQTTVTRKIESPSTIKTDTPVLPAPTVTFDTYSFNTTYPRVPDTLSNYSLMTNLTMADIRALGHALGLTEEKTLTYPFTMMANTTDVQSRGVLTVNTETGSFTFQSYGLHKPNGLEEKDPAIVARTYIQQLGLDDNTLTEPVTYKTQENPNVTYVEFHRDWSTTQLPILNPIGLLNLPEGKPLRTLQLGEMEPFTLRNESIIAASDKQNAVSRPNDFNTITVVVSSEGTILSIESNIRKIISTAQISKNDLLTPEEALQQFHKNGGDFSLTIPAGTGSVSWQNVYPNNKAHAKTAIITDYILTYLEKPPSVRQASLVPMYTIRGIATLDSGYTVRFLQTLPALKDGQSIFAGVAKAVAGAQTKNIQPTDNKSLQLQPFYPTDGPVPSPTAIQEGETPNIPTATPKPQGPNPLANCPTWVNATNVTIQIPGLGQIDVAINQPFYNSDKKERDRHGPHTFFFRSATFPLSDIQDVKDKFFFGVDDLSKPPGPLEKQLMINVAKRTKGNINATSIDEMYAVFKQLNIPGTSSPCDTSTRSVEPMAPPDLRKCVYDPKTYQGAGLDIPRLQKLGDNVAKRLLQAKQDGTLQSLTYEPNVFPRETVSAFSFIFSNATSSMYSGETQERFKACYITGTSPLLYLYPEKATEVTVKTTGPLTYTDPGTVHNQWTIIAQPNGILSSQANSVVRPYIYYEYDQSKVSFTTSGKGWVIKKMSWIPLSTICSRSKLDLPVMKLIL